MAPKQLDHDDDTEDEVIEEDEIIEEEDEVWSHVPNTIHESFVEILEQCMTPDTQKIYNGYRQFRSKTRDSEDTTPSPNSQNETPSSKSNSMNCSSWFKFIVGYVMIVVAATSVCFIRYRSDMIEELGALKDVIGGKDLLIQHYLKNLQEVQNEKNQLLEHIVKQNHIIELNTLQIVDFQIVRNDTMKVIEDKNIELEENEYRFHQWISQCEKKIREKQIVIRDNEESYQMEKSKLSQMLYYSVLSFMSNNPSDQYDDDVIKKVNNLSYSIDEDLNDIMNSLKDVNLHHAVQYEDESVAAISKTNNDRVALWGCWFLNMLAKNDGIYDSTIIESGGLTFLSNVIETYSHSRGGIKSRNKHDDYVTTIIRRNARQTIQILLNQREIIDEMNHYEEEEYVDSNSKTDNDFDGICIESDEETMALVTSPWKQRNPVGVVDTLHRVLSYELDCLYSFLWWLFT